MKYTDNLGNIQVKGRGGQFDHAEQNGFLANSCN